MGNPHSTSGYLVPKRELKDVEINLDNRLHFSKIIEANNHDEAIRILLEVILMFATVSSVNLLKNIAHIEIALKGYVSFMSLSLFQALHCLLISIAQTKKIRSKISPSRP